MTEGRRAANGGTASDGAASGRPSTEGRQQAGCWRKDADGGPATRRPSTKGRWAVDESKGAYAVSVAPDGSKGVYAVNIGGPNQIKGRAR